MHIHAHVRTALRLNIAGDTQNIVEQRIIFENGNAMLTKEVNAIISTQSCTAFRAFVRVHTVYH